MAGKASDTSAEQEWIAVADPSRHRIVDLLLEHDRLSQTALAAKFPVSRQSVAKHLDVLEKAGLLRAERDGREVRYSLVRDRLGRVTTAMLHMAARWDLRLSQQSGDDLKRDE